MSQRCLTRGTIECRGPEMSRPQLYFKRMNPADQLRSGPKSLNYAMPRRPRRRLRYRFIGLAAVLLWIFLENAVPPVVARARIIRWQRQCERYVDSRPDAVFDAARDGTPQQSPQPIPQCWTQLSKLQAPPPVPGVFVPVDILFLHKLTTSNGCERLICLSVSDYKPDAGIEILTYFLNEATPQAGDPAR
jgi:hypothetical protein